MFPHHTPAAPPVVTQAAATLTGHGYTCTVHPEDGRRWRLEADQDNVHAVFRYKAPGFSPARLTEAQFTIGDSEPYDVCCPNDLAAHVDEIRSPSAPAVPDPLPPARPISDAPPKLRHWYRLMARRFPENEDAMTVASATADAWVVALDLPSATVRMYYRRRKGRWNLDKRRPMQVILGGVDYSSYVGDDFEALLTLLGGSTGSVATPSSIGSTAAAKKTNSVQVRRSTVIRV